MHEGQRTILDVRKHPLGDAIAVFNEVELGEAELWVDDPIGTRDSNTADDGAAWLALTHTTSGHNMTYARRRPSRYLIIVVIALLTGQGMPYVSPSLATAPFM